MSRRTTALATGAAAALALVLVLLWHSGRDVASPPGASGPGAAATGAADPAPVELPDLPPPVDPDAVDRDRDLFGVVLGPERRPVAGARVDSFRKDFRLRNLLHPEEDPRVTGGPSTRTAADGSFVLRLAPGQVVTLRVRAAGFPVTLHRDARAGGRVEILLGGDGALEVRAVDPAGNPVANAVVSVYRFTLLSSVAFSREGRTGADGRCRIDALPPGRVGVSCLHDAWGDPGDRQTHVPGSGTARVRFEMPAGRTVLGIVLEEGGSPIAGAKVGNPGGDRTVVTDEGGRFAYPRWTREENARLEARAEGYGVAQAPVPAKGEVEIRLLPEAAVAGRVLDAGGAPVVAAAVYCGGQDGRFPEHQTDGHYLRTDGEGRFRAEGLRREFPYTLLIRADGHAELKAGFLVARGEAPLMDLGDLRLGVERRVGGRVVRSDGSPVAGERIQVRVWAGQESRCFLRQRTDDLGRFLFRGLVPGRCSIECSPDAAKGFRRSVELPPDRDVLDLEFTIDVGRELRVRVTDAEGAPVPNARVSGGGIVGHTDEEGLVTLLGVPGKGAGFFVAAHWDDWPHVPFLERNVTVPDGAGEITVVLRRAASIRGVVLDPDGRPYPRVYVRVLRDGRGLSKMSGTDDDGRFVVAGPVGDEVTLLVDGTRMDWKDGDGPYRLPLEGRVEGVRAPAEGIVIRTARIDVKRSLTAWVLDYDARPVAGASVTIFGSSRAEKRTGEDGTAKFEDLVARPITVRVELGGENLPEDAVPPPDLQVVPEDQTVRLTYQRGKILAGRILLDETGEPAVGADVYSFTGNATLERVKTDEEGRFRALVLPVTGSLAVVWSRGLEDVRARRDIKVAHEDREVTIRMKKREKR